MGLLQHKGLCTVTLMSRRDTSGMPPIGSSRVNCNWGTFFARFCDVYQGIYGPESP